MKFIENQDLEDLSRELSSKQVGLNILRGRIEAIQVDEPTSSNDDSESCEFNVFDPHSRKRSSSLGNYSFLRPARKRSSSVGDLSEPSNQHLFTQIIATLNESFPDYDFSRIRSSQFPHQDVHTVIRRVNSYLAEFCEFGSDFLSKLWKTIDIVVNLYQCDIFSYIPALDDDYPFNEGALWSFNYFFFSKDLMRICYLSCSASSNLRMSMVRERDEDEDESELEDIDDSVDILNDSCDCTKPHHSRDSMEDEPDEEDDEDDDDDEYVFDSVSNIESNANGNHDEEDVDECPDPNVPDWEGVI